MKLTKGQGISLFAALIIFGIFNTVVFLMPLAHTVAFWLGYLFELFALAAIASTLVLYFGKVTEEDKFLNLPAIKLAWTYFVLQTGLSLWEMIAFPLSYMPALAINLVLGAVFAIIILALYAASGKIDKSEQYTAEKVIFIKELKLKLESVDVEDADLGKKIKALAEDVRFSDQMSHSKLAGIESELEACVDELVDNAENTENALALCDKAAKLLKKRNEQCKMYKGVKDVEAAKAQKSDNGLGVAFAGVCAMLAIFLIALSVYFIVVPKVKYNDALALMNEAKYEEAIEAFAELEGYSDSKAKIEEIKTILLDQVYDSATALMNEEKYEEAIAAFEEIEEHRDSKDKIEEIKTIVLDNGYDEAVALMNEGKYDEAIEAFRLLGDHRDSKEKIEEIKTTVLDIQYGEAEALFNAGKYSEAINIYSSLNGYKESKLRVEQIYNRLSEDDIIYFGTYNGEPIAWKIVKTESDKMLLLAEEPIAQKPFDDDIKNVTWSTSSLRTWLNEEFIKSFSAAQQEQILATDTGETEDKVFLLDVDEMVAMAKDVLFKTAEEWWTRTSADGGIMYTTAEGWVTAEGDLIVRDKGVRPSIWINLE